MILKIVIFPFLFYIWMHFISHDYFIYIIYIYIYVCVCSSTLHCSDCTTHRELTSYIVSSLCTTSCSSTSHYVLHTKLCSCLYLCKKESNQILLLLWVRSQAVEHHTVVVGKLYIFSTFSISFSPLPRAASKCQLSC